MKAISRLKHEHFKVALFVLTIFLLGTGFGYFYVSRTSPNIQVKQEKNTPKAFLSESYDKIKDNFWDNISDGQLIEFFRLAAEKNGASLPVKISSKDQLITHLISAQNNLSSDQRAKFIPTVLGTVLASLNPPGRSGSDEYYDPGDISGFFQTTGK